jgi:hypothetical protein
MERTTAWAPPSIAFALVQRMFGCSGRVATLEFRILNCMKN